MTRKKESAPKLTYNLVTRARERKKNSRWDRRKTFGDSTGGESHKQRLLGKLGRDEFSNFVQTFLPEPCQV